MFRLGVFAVCLVLALDLAKSSSNDLKAKAIIVQNLTSLLSKDPNVEFLNPMAKKQSNPSPKLDFSFEFGSRIDGEYFHLN